MARYTPDYRGIGNYLQHSPQLKKELHRRLILGQGVAVGLAPRSRTDERKGIRLSESSEIRDDGPNGGVNGDRMQMSLHFTAPHAVPVTFRRGDPSARDYLLAALAVMQRGN